MKTLTCSRCRRRLVVAVPTDAAINAAVTAFNRHICRADNGAGRKNKNKEA